jgi:hypothetical protein
MRLLKSLRLTHLPWMQEAHKSVYTCIVVIRIVKNECWRKNPVRLVTCVDLVLNCCVANLSCHHYCYSYSSWQVKFALILHEYYNWQFNYLTRRGNEVSCIWFKPLSTAEVSFHLLAPGFVYAYGFVMNSLCDWTYTHARITSIPQLMTWNMSG